MAETMKCTCKSPYQDSLYGVGNRVFTTSTKGFPLVDRCTVCGKTRQTETKGKEKRK